MLNRCVFTRSARVLNLFFSRRAIAQPSTMASLAMDKRYAFVSCNEDAKRLVVSFLFKTDFVEERFFKIDRNPDECIDASLKRLKTNIEAQARKKWAKKKKKAIEKSEDALPDPSVEVSVIDASGTVLEPHCLNKEAFVNGHQLRVGDQCLPIIVNAPTINLLSMPRGVTKGFPFVPRLEVEHVDDILDCQFSWWRQTRTRELEKESPEVPSEDILDYARHIWRRIRGADQISYTPVEEDVGKLLMVLCEPRNGESRGVTLGAFTSKEVLPFDLELPNVVRQKSTPTVLEDDKFRVVTYNILAETYSVTPVAKTQLFPYCHKDVLNFDYRKMLLNKEIIGFNGDIVCLQEVDRSMFTRNLEILLRLQGMRGIYSEKGDIGEGEALFYRASKFELVEKKVSSIYAAIRDDECLADIRSIVKSNSVLEEKLSNMVTIVQIAVLRHLASDRHIVVCNTHLYFHPDADFIKMIQAWACLRLAENVVKRLQDEMQAPSLIFCGDFNSTPDFGVYKLFTTGSVPRDDPEFTEGFPEIVKGIRVTVPRTLLSACGTPQYTNYIEAFDGCLDYIFHSKDLKTDAVVPLPDHSLVKHPEYRALPSPIFPSDHLPLIADLSFVD